MTEGALGWMLPLAGVVVLWAVFWLVWPMPLTRLLLAGERRRARLRARRLRCAGIDWHLLEGGHGEPLVLLHGFNGNSYHFSRVARRLGTHFRILAPDLPGFGETRVDDLSDLRIEAQAEQLLALLDELGIERFYLGGSSMGGYIACALARLAPERVSALWLLAPGGLHTATLAPLFEIVSKGGDNALLVRNRKDFNRLMDYCFVKPPWLPGPIARTLTSRAASNSDQTAAMFEAIRYRSLPLEEMASGLDMPCLIVWGQSDQVLHPDGMKVLAERLPQARTLLLPDTGHLPMIERPRTVAESWISFAEAQARDRGRLELGQ